MVFLVGFNNVLVNIQQTVRDAKTIVELRTSSGRLSVRSSRLRVRVSRWKTICAIIWPQHTSAGMSNINHSSLSINHFLCFIFPCSQTQKLHLSHEIHTYTTPMYPQSLLQIHDPLKSFKPCSLQRLGHEICTDLICWTILNCHILLVCDEEIL